MPQPFTPDLERALAAPYGPAFLAVGADADVDTAFDDATETAWYEYGRARVIPSVASIDAGDVHPLDAPPVSRALAQDRALSMLAAGELVAGRAYALPLTEDASYRRRRVNLTLTDAELDIADDAGMLPMVPPALAERLLAEAAAAGSELADGEVLESVDVRRIRARYKPVATPHPGKTASSFAVMVAGTDTLLPGRYATAGLARRACVELAKAGPLEGQHGFTLEVVKLSAREDSPLVTVARIRVAQRATVRLTFAAQKNPDKTKITGWLFFGHLGDNTTDDEVAGDAPAE